MNYKYILFFLIIVLNTINIIGQDTIKEIIYHPIGVFHTEYTPETGAPRQGTLVPESKGHIELQKKYQEALKTLDFFEYIIVIYHFNKTNPENWKPYVNPPASTDKHNFGLFSTRSPRRPNPIGFGVIKLDSIRENILYVSGIDVFDGTPVLDIKPYLPSVDYVKSVQNELIEKELGHHNQKYIKDTIWYK